MPDAWFAVAAFPPAATGFEGGSETWPIPNPYANTPPWPPWFGAGGGGVSEGGYPRAGSGSHSEMSRTAILTPVIIATVALVGSAFLLVTYYRVFARYCSAWRIFRGVRRRRGGGGDGDGDYPGAGGGIEQGFLAIAANTGLDEAIVKKIPVYLYSEGVVSGSECAVCLGEFEDEDELRLLPKCAHAFHVACIDAWLRSHSNCPLCRAIVAAPAVYVGSGAGTRSQAEQQEQPQAEQQPELSSGETHQGELVLTLGVDSAETQDEDGPPIGAAAANGVEYRRSSSMRAVDTSPDRGKELRRCHSVGSKKPIKYESGEPGFVVLNIEVGSSSSSSASSSSGGGEGEENDGNSGDGGGGGGDRRSPLRKSSLLRAPASLMHGVFSLGLRKSGSHSEGGGP